MPNDLQRLQKGVTNYVDDAIKNAPYTEVVTGVILSDDTIFSKGYSISINGKEYRNVPRIGDTKYGRGTTVKIEIPNGQYNNMFIVGRVKMGDEGQKYGNVTSVNGMDGDVVLDKGDIGLGNVDNTSDLNKPISIATQTALNLKADKGTFDNNTALTGGTVYSNVQVTDGMVTGVTTKTLTTANIEPTTTRRYVPEIPAIDASSKFLNGDGVFTAVSVGGSTSSGNMYFSNIASDISTYLKSSYDSDVSETTKTITVNNTADVLGNTYLYDSPLGIDTIDAGIWKSTFNIKVSNAVGITRLKIVAFMRETTGVETDLFTKYTDEINSTSFTNIYTETNRAQITVSPTARLGFRIYGTTTANTNIVISYNIGGINGSYINSPLALRHSQLRDKDGEIAYQHITLTTKTDLTDGGDTTLHYHASDRNRTNHTGTQLASTISDFASAVRATVLTGLSTATSAVISATDTVLSALGKLQAQITGLALNANKTVYVATTGSDTTGDGTSGNPYKTITKGLSVIPKDLNGYNGTVNVATGTYSETMNISGYHGGILLVVFSGNVTINNIAVSSTQFAYVYGSSSMVMTLISTTSNPISVSNKSSLYIPSSVSTTINTSTARVGMLVTTDSNADIQGTMTVNNANYALQVLSSKVFVGTLAGSGNNYGIVGTEGSVISYGTKTISATTDNTLSGGSIITNLIGTTTSILWNE